MGSDRFHVVRVAADAVDQVRRDEWNEHGRSKTTIGRRVKRTRRTERRRLESLVHDARRSRGRWRRRGS